MLTPEWLFHSTDRINELVQALSLSIAQDQAQRMTRIGFTEYTAYQSDKLRELNALQADVEAHIIEVEKAVKTFMACVGALPNMQSYLGAKHPDELEAYGRHVDAVAAWAQGMREAMQLAGIMEMAGQLGVRGSDNLTKFTETIAALDVSTNLTRESASKMLAQFANVTGMDLGNIDRLGSVIVELGNNFATTESDIVNMARGIAQLQADNGAKDDA